MFCFCLLLIMEATSYLKVQPLIIYLYESECYLIKTNFIFSSALIINIIENSMDDDEIIIG